MLLELGAWMVLLFLLACLYLGVETMLKEQKSEKRFRAMESSLGHGRRVTFTVDNGGQFPVRAEVDGVVYGFRHVWSLSEFVVACYTHGESVSAQRFGGILLSHPSLRGLV